MIPRVIGLSGKRRTGKTTVGGILSRRFAYKQEAFADNLKGCLQLLCGWSLDHTDGPLKEVVDPAFGFTPRLALVEAGSALRKSLGTDIFIRGITQRLYKHLQSNPRYKVVVMDVRYPNEAQAIRDLGGVVWRIRGPNREPGATAMAGVDMHPTETAMDGASFEAVINNTGTLDELVVLVTRALAEGGRR